MAFTNNCDLHAPVNEDGVSTVVTHHATAAIDIQLSNRLNRRASRRRARRQRAQDADTYNPLVGIERAIAPAGIAALLQVNWCRQHRAGRRHGHSLHERIRTGARCPVTAMGPGRARGSAALIIVLLLWPAATTSLSRTSIPLAASANCSISSPDTSLTDATCALDDAGDLTGQFTAPQAQQLTPPQPQAPTACQTFGNNVICTNRIMIKACADTSSDLCACAPFDLETIILPWARQGHRR
jgi:hypothetical protein